MATVDKINHQNVFHEKSQGMGFLNQRSEWEEDLGIGGSHFKDG